MNRIWSGLVLVVSLGASGCASVKSVLPGTPAAPPEITDEAAREREALRERETLRARLKSTPHAAAAATRASETIRTAALNDRGLRIVVSTAERQLWLMQNDSVLQIAPIAVGMHERFTWAGKTYDFKTPHSKRKVIAKGVAPLWVPPDWHYFEKAAQDSLAPVQLKKGQVVRLSDSTRIEVRGDQVGRVNRGNWWPFAPGSEIIFEGKIFIPPMGSGQRRVPEVLGTHKLEIGEGYLIHGTNEETSVGEAVSHGCVRMYNEDVARLYAVVPVGTPVYIF